MEAFYHFASGGSTVQQFAKDVYLKGQLTSKISSLVNSLIQESQSLKDIISPGQRSRLIVPGTIPFSDSTSPNVSELCDVLEAALLHGLKEKLSLSKMKAAVLGPRSPIHNGSSSVKTSNQNSVDSLEFWPIIQILCHNQLSDNLQRLKSVYTEIGKCRAWLRLILNDSLFGSYMIALTNDTSLLHGFYRSNAYLRDREHVELLLTSLRQLDSLSFQLNYDDGSLNTWTAATLKYIGIQVPDDPSPVMPAVEALDDIKGSDTHACAISEIRSRFNRSGESPHSKNCSRNHSDSLDSQASVNGSCDGISVALRSTSLRNNNSFVSPPSSAMYSGENDPQSKYYSQSSESLSRDKVTNSSRPVTPTINLISESGSHSIQLEAQSPPLAVPHARSRLHRNSHCSRRSSNCQSPSDDLIGSPTSNTSCSKRPGWTSSPPKMDDFTVTPSDFTSVFNKYYESNEVVLSSTPDMREFNFTPPSRNGRHKTPAILFAESKSRGARESSENSTSRSFNHAHRIASRVKMNAAKENQVSSLMQDFEVIPKNVVIDNSSPDTQEFLSQLCKLPGERGLDEQDYKCRSCARPIGLIYGKYRLCKFDGHLYCIDCHVNDEAVIPSRVVHNWDFTKYPVSKKNKQLLDATETDALLDLKVTSAILYQVTPEMKTLLDLRTQLFFLHAYLFTCTEPVALELRKMFWPREHLFEHIHLYSLSDLIGVAKGSLVKTLKKAINFARKHVLSCRLCSEKGFICEFCKSEQIIYPFDTASTVRCDSGCRAVYHASCVSASKVLPDLCPRCIRIARRKKLDQM